MKFTGMRNALGMGSKRSAMLWLGLVLMAQGAAANDLDKFKWRGVKSTADSYLLYRSLPGDSTVHDIYMSCKKGDSDITVAFATRPQGSYTNAELANAAQRPVEKARFFVDNKSVDEIDVTLGQAENFARDDAGALNMDFELGAKDKLLVAMISGKSIRVELPRAKSHSMPLAGFARPAREMIVHCKL